MLVPRRVCFFWSVLCVGLGIDGFGVFFCVCMYYLHIYNTYVYTIICMSIQGLNEPKTVGKQFQPSQQVIICTKNHGPFRPPKIDMEPKNHQIEKETHLPNRHCLVPHQSSWWFQPI